MREVCIVHADGRVDVVVHATGPAHEAVWVAALLPGLERTDDLIGILVRDRR